MGRRLCIRRIGWRVREGIHAEPIGVEQTTPTGTAVVEWYAPSDT